MIKGCMGSSGRGWVKQHDGLGSEEGGCGGKSTHRTSLSLVYSTQTFVYIITCPVHGEVHNNDMRSRVCAHTSTNLIAASLARRTQTPSSSHSHSFQKQF